ncbi:PSD1 and planctomycete cytochrome C domain-containing protein [Opitutales bacterium]|nr:PSD1 and planctomycete cytochrome C domain-containing protein [Opitutales bacterium]
MINYKISLFLLLFFGYSVLAKIDFNRQIRPILSEYCFACHGLDDPQGGLRLDFAEFAYKGGKSGFPAVAPDDLDESEILHRVVSTDEDDRMPPKGDPLKPKQIEVLREWISSGAKYAKHWAYVIPDRPTLPKVEKKNFVKTPIDHFILSKLEEKGLKPSQPEKKEKWIRRVSLGLTGLPPTIEEFEEFMQDDSSKAREKVVDRLLASPRYGEHWARQWLDLARYADSNGFQADQLRDSWAFRDWVINAINQDMPFDQFTIEQIAGDLLPNANIDQKIATGFHRTPTCNVEAGVHPEENRVNQVFDRVNATGTTWLGTTMECAQCHSHKYDPFSQEEYFKMFAFFNNTPLEVENKSGKGVSFDFWGPKMELSLSPEKQKQRDSLNNMLNAQNVELATLKKEANRKYKEWTPQKLEVTKDKEPEWQVLTPTKAVSDGVENLRIVKDGSLLAEGKSGDKSTYQIEVSVPAGTWKSFQMETMLHKSMKQNGPGRNSTNANPNFVLTEMTIKVEGSSKPLDFGRVLADFNQGGFLPQNLFDGNLDSRNGWAIAPEFGKAHWVQAEFAEPLELVKDSKLLVEMKHLYGGGRNVGRPRFSLSKEGVKKGEAENKRLHELLAKEKRNGKEEKELRAIFDQGNPKLLAIRKKVEDLEKSLKKVTPPTTLVMVEMDEKRETHVMARGSYLSPKQKVEADVPQVLNDWKPKWPKNRLGLAKWLVDPENPLTARVIVNRWWGQFFGSGIVSTEEDFGSQSEPPTHPELLDWLAVEFMQSGWSMKHIHKLIALSSTYGQSSRITTAMLERDANNRFFLRGPRFRMTAEMIRDNGLQIAGLLSGEMGGPPVYPPQPDGLWRQTGRNEPKYIAAETEDRFRRGIYVIWRRAAPYASFVNFDGPDRSACHPKRSRTNTPLQALTLLNDQAYVEMALGFAVSILKKTQGLSDRDRVTHAVRRALSRDPSALEIKVLLSLLNEQIKRLKSDSSIAKSLLSQAPQIEISEKLESNEVGAWFFVANALLNLDETITKG